MIDMVGQLRPFDLHLIAARYFDAAQQDRRSATMNAQQERHALREGCLECRFIAGSNIDAVDFQYHRWWLREASRPDKHEVGNSGQVSPARNIVWRAAESGSWAVSSLANRKRPGYKCRQIGKKGSAG